MAIINERKKDTPLIGKTDAELGALLLETFTALANGEKATVELTTDEVTWLGETFKCGAETALLVPLCDALRRTGKSAVNVQNRYDYATHIFTFW